MYTEQPMVSIYRIGFEVCLFLEMRDLDQMTAV